MDECVASYDIVSSLEEYQAMSMDQKKTYDVLAIWMTKFAA